MSCHSSRSPSSAAWCRTPPTPTSAAPPTWWPVTTTPRSPPPCSTSSDRSIAPLPVRRSELALVQLAVGVARHLDDEVDGLGQLVLGQPRRRVVEDRGGQAVVARHAGHGLHHRLDLLAP